MEVNLVMFKADGERRDFPLKHETTVIGRKPTCGLRIPLSAVSREHCKIEIRDDGVYFQDLGSSNGTFYNGERTTEGQLKPGDRLEIGSVIFTVQIDGQPTEIEPISTILPEDTAAAIASAPASAGAKPQVIDNQPEMPEPVDEETASPTTEIEDDDPIAALEKLAQSTDLDDAADEPIPLFDEDEDED